MATMKQEYAGFITPRRPAVELPRLRWTQILSISIFAFALNFHWAALGIIILPSQVLKIVGDLNKGTALAFVLVHGAFVSLFSNPLFGWLSDQTHGRLAVWGFTDYAEINGTAISASRIPTACTRVTRSRNRSAANSTVAAG